VLFNRVRGSVQRTRLGWLAQPVLTEEPTAIGGRRHVAEDACSFAWLQLLRTQPERDSVFPWLCVVATNEARRLLKGQARQAEFDEDAAGSAPSPSGRGTDLQLAVEVREAFEHIAELSAQHLHRQRQIKRRAY
jgi:DNA-directed RNA polymerase specialized sigma24 family protein